MDNLQSGIDLFKSGKRDEARKYFIAAMKEDPSRENVWGWLYQVSNNDKERIQALTKVVSINPNNVQAKQLLDKLQAPEFINSEPIQKAPPPTRDNLQPVHKLESKKPIPIQQKNLLIGIGSVVLICFICVCAFTLYSPPAGPKDYKTMAFVMCTLFTEDRLKSPSTADFPSSSSSDIRDLGNNIFEVRSYVDAQNSFGATIRRNFYCKVQFLGTDKDDENDGKFWMLVDFQLFE